MRRVDEAGGRGGWTRRVDEPGCGGVQEGVSSKIPCQSEERSSLCAAKREWIDFPAFPVASLRAPWRVRNEVVGHNLQLRSQCARLELRQRNEGKKEG